MPFRAQQNVGAGPKTSTSATAANFIMKDSANYLEFNFLIIAPKWMMDLVIFIFEKKFSNFETNWVSLFWRKNKILN